MTSTEPTAIREQQAQDAPDVTVNTDTTANQQSLTLGLIASPEIGERAAADICPELPDLLARYVDDQPQWYIATVTDPLTGANVDADELLDEVDARQDREAWDYAISLTDLPMRNNGQTVVANASVQRNIAAISLPALGAIRPHHRVREAVLQLMQDLYHRQATHKDAKLDGVGVAQRVVPGENDQKVDVRYVAAPLIGQVRLLAGMVYANQPWTIFTSFRTAIATAFATGIYGLIFPTVWTLGNTYSLIRLAMLMLVAMTVLTAWTIISHDLWENGKQKPSAYLTTMYNLSTVFTVAAAVIFAYAVLFLLVLIAALFFVPDGLLGAKLQHPAGLANYLKLTWVIATFATIAGAVGAGTANTRAVRQATFSWRQWHSYQTYEQEHGDDDNG